MLTVSIGREPGNGIQLADPAVSGRHASIGVHDGHLRLVDLGSRNGTFVNGQHVSEARVQAGDRVLIGSVPLPWNHPALAPLLAAVRGQAAEAHYPPTTEDEPLSLPTRRTPWFSLAAVAFAALLLAGVAAAIVLPGSEPQDGAPARPVSEQGPRTLSASTSEPITLDGNPVATALFAERVADQIDIRRQEERVRELRFRLRSRVTETHGWDEDLPTRTSWAVPLGVVDREGRPTLAVATTRCVVDYRFPIREQHADSYVNLALFSGSGRAAQVFRVSRPRDLAGLRFYDQDSQIRILNRGRRYLSGPHGERYFTTLRDPLLGAEARLPVGQWGSAQGVDIAVLYFPLADSGVSALDPRPGRTLRMRDPEARLRDALADRTSLWGDTFEFSLISDECVRYTQQRFSDLEGRVETVRVFAVATALVLVGVITGGVGSGAFAALKPLVSTALARRVVTAAAGAVFRTVIRHVNGENLEDVAWDEAGRLLVHFLRPNGEVEETVVAGLTRSGLSDERAGQVASAVSSLIRRQGNFTVPTMRRPGEEVGALMHADSQTDIAAELIARGLVRLDTSSEQQLRQQPTLLRAARDALLAGPPDDSPLADSAYRARVHELSRILAVN